MPDTETQVERQSKQREKVYREEHRAPNAETLAAMRAMDRMMDDQLKLLTAAGLFDDLEKNSRQ